MEQQSRLPAGAAVALVVGMTIGNIGGNLMPVLLDGFGARHHLSPSQAGAVAAAQLLATALVSLALAGRAARPGRVRMARIGLAIAAVGFIAAWLGPSAPVLAVANVVAGAGLGAVFAAASAALSSTPDVDRATTLTVLCSTLAIAALILAVPLANRIGGGTASFAVLAACCLAGALLVRGLPELPGAAGAAGAAASVAGPRLSPVYVAAVVLFGITEQGLWSYAAVFGGEAGLDEAESALVLGIAAIGALAGVPLAALLRRRWGPVVALAAVMAAGTGAKFAVVALPAAAAGGATATAFGVAAVVWQICYLAVLVLVLAVAGNLDPSGRWVAASAGALALGTGIGPAVIGFGVENLGGPGLGLCVVAGAAAAAIPVLRVAARSHVTV